MTDEKMIVEHYFHNLRKIHKIASALIQLRRKDFKLSYVKSTYSLRNYWLCIYP